MINIDFKHRQSAHCESGVTSNLLFHYNVNCSEALAFGIGSGIFFGYLPFIRLNNLPLTTYRCAVGNIFKLTNKRLNVIVKRQKFKSPHKAMQALDDKLKDGIPVGCQTGAYWLPYFPPAFRFHFNMHNLVVIGKQGDDYIISDPVFNDPVICHKSDLMKARFAKGALAPSGSMYYLKSIPENPDIEKAVKTGIKSVCKTMLKIPFPIFGIKGIKFLAHRIKKWPLKLGKESAGLHLGQLIRMQEEIGTGGGGFRFMYAAFLQEAAVILKNNRINYLSEQMTQTGDEWRKFAASGARICKGRAKSIDTYDAIAEILIQCAKMEKTIYQELIELV